MLEVIADFWKPVKKAPMQDKLQPEQLQVGSSIGFGFVPQAMLSGRRLTVSAINCYQFGDETLTSFVLTQEKDAGVSMIVAESDGEQYLAISRRISINDRMRLFDSHDLENAMARGDTARLPCKDNMPDYKGWTVASYKREIQGLKGRLFKGDYRGKAAPGANDGQEFAYTLLVSDSNEHAIEIEKYNDGRVEVYATIYRRMNDVGEVTHPVNELVRPDIRLASKSEDAPAIQKSEAVPVLAPAPKVEPVAVAKAEPVIIEHEPIAATKPSEPVASAAAPLQPPVKTEEKKPMITTDNGVNGARNDLNGGDAGSKMFVQSTAPDNYLKQEVKAVTHGATNNFDTDAIECDLRVANKIIDEAIRNEMRLTDIVRRIIELPVAYPESVQIPVTLTDEDYSLLAIRYSISPSDRNAIKRRIVEDLNDFSGNKKAA